MWHCRSNVTCQRFDPVLTVPTDFCVAFEPAYDCILPFEEEGRTYYKCGVQFQEGGQSYHWCPELQNITDIGAKKIFKNLLRVRKLLFATLHWCPVKTPEGEEAIKVCESGEAYSYPQLQYITHSPKTETIGCANIGESNFGESNICESTRYS